jgi:hypothetical protein
MNSSQLKFLTFRQVFYKIPCCFLSKSFRFTISIDCWVSNVAPIFVRVIVGSCLTMHHCDHRCCNHNSFDLRHLTCFTNG